MLISSLAGNPAPQSILINVSEIISAYYEKIPNPAKAKERVSFGTSGHRGSSLEISFNEQHIVCISQAICDFRKIHHVTGPLFLGVDTHALSAPAFKSALQVLAANDIHVQIAKNNEYTPTPVISHAILRYNQGRKTELADGIVITPSHNPPQEGGFKYNFTHGGPADVDITQWIEARANELLQNPKQCHLIPFEKALKAKTTHFHDFLHSYINDLGSVIDMEIIRAANLRLGVDPLGGAGVHYWKPIAERYGLNLTVVNEAIDPTFRFMTVDWDGQIRMDPSSTYAMQRLITMKDQFDIAFACDTDHDRHGIVTKSSGLLPSNHFLTVAIDYLFQHRPQWQLNAQIGKTVVSSSMIDRVATKINREIYEVPVGFKWFVEGLFNGTLGFGGEESAGAVFLRKDGTVWTTDKDGIVSALLAAEITARMKRDPGAIYTDLTKALGTPIFERIEAHATDEQKKRLKKISPEQIRSKELAGEPIQSIITHAPGNHASIGGIKVTTKNGWFAARPSGTEDIYKIYGESFLGKDHLKRILQEAQMIVNAALSHL